MAIHIQSEITQLRTVLLHRPGSELEQLAPNSMARLLFDDIPYLRGAQTEHDAFANVLRAQGVQVFYLSELTAQTLAQSEALRQQFINDFIHRSGCVADSYREALVELLMAIEDPHALVLKTMGGVRFDELPLHLNCGMAFMRSDRTHFILEPIPNLYFTRDPFASIGNGVSLHHMYSVTRNRETIYGDYILHYHHSFAGKVPFYYTPDEPFTLKGVAIMHHEGVDVSITGNSTNPTRFQHPVAGTYKKECIEQGKKYFSVASGGGTGRTLHPDNMAAGPASYGMTDTMGRMHSDAQFAGSSSVPAHVEMMGFLGMGNNPMVGATVAVAVAVAEALKK